MKTMKVKSIKKLEGKRRVINLNVDKNHTFVTKNGIVTHNCDYFSPNAQAALRNVINTNLNYCRWIMTANYPEKIIPEMRNGRTPEIDFSYSETEIKEVAPTLFKRVLEILKMEEIAVENPKALAQFIFKTMPNVRFILKTLQNIAAQNCGKIPAEISVKKEELTVEFFKNLLNQNYDDIVRFVHRTPQSQIMMFIEMHLTDLVSDFESQKTLMTWAAHYQSMSKGVETIYTITLLMNMKGLLK